MRMPQFLVETALIAHGLPSISDEDLLAVCSGFDLPLTWVDRGKIVIGNCAEFLSFRGRTAFLRRIDSKNLDAAIKNEISASLTVSGTMAVCAKLGIPIAVTGGMGGIRGMEISSDLFALAELPVALIATSPKDMLDIPKTIEWLMAHQVLLWGLDTEFCSGFLFRQKEVPLSGKWSDKTLSPHTLLLIPISEKLRLTDPTVLRQAVRMGVEEQDKGKSFHPAVNVCLDKLTYGQSSKLQLDALIANVNFATKID